MCVCGTCVFASAEKASATTTSVGRMISTPLDAAVFSRSRACHCARAPQRKPTRSSKVMTAMTTTDGNSLKTFCKQRKPTQSLQVIMVMTTTDGNLLKTFCKSQTAYTTTSHSLVHVASMSSHHNDNSTKPYTAVGGWCIRQTNAKTKARQVNVQNGACLHASEPSNGNKYREPHSA